jgi:NAD(P)H dehydrogenase (quinone)
LIAATIGSRAHMFGEGAVHGELEPMFRALLRGTFGYVGMSVLEPFVAWHVPYVDDMTRRGMLADYAARLQAIESEEPIATCPSLSDFDEQMVPLPRGES